MNSTITKNYLEDTASYLNIDRKRRILLELYWNAFITIKNVYLFKHFDEYVRQLQSDKNDEKQDIYWNASYYEKLIDYIKISVAFETYNKAVLLENGFIVHKIKKNQSNKLLFEQQQKGEPVLISDYLNVSEEISDFFDGKVYLSGFKENFETINYSLTLSPKYQEIIQLEKELCSRLKEINDKRNRLHFFTEFKGAFEHSSHIRNWTYIKDTSTILLEKKYKSYEE